MGLLDWLINDGDPIGGGNPMQPAPPMLAPVLDQQGNGVGQDVRRHVPSMQTQPAPPMQMTGQDLIHGQDPMAAGGKVPNGPGLPFTPGTDPMTAGGSPPNGPGLPFAPGGDPMTAGGGAPNGPGLPFAPGTDPMLAGGEMPNGPGLPPPPMPQPRPPGLGGGPAALPPAAAPTGGAGMPPGPPAQLSPPGASPAPPGGDGSTALSRALGLDPNRARAAAGGLGAGLKAAGANSNKPGLAAFAGSAGAAIEGGQKTDDKTFEKQDKYLQRAIQAKKEGNNAAYQQNYLRYQIEAAKAKLEASKEKATTASVVNSPEQLYLRAVGATNQDAGIKISANTVKEAQKQFGADSKEAKAALAEHEARIKSVRDSHFATLGIDPKSIKGLENKPGFSDKNPVKDFPKDPAAAQKAFDALPEGAYFINPKDGRLLTKKSAGGAAAPNPAQSAAPSLTPPIPPVPSAPPMLQQAPQLEPAE